MNQNDIRKPMQRFATRVILSGAIIILVLNGIYILMTWLTNQFITISNHYLKSETAYLGTMIIALIILIIIFIINYRKRKRELVTLSENIQKVAAGDYSARITYKKRDTMANVYRDFNKMSVELSSVSFLRKDFINNYSHEFKTPIASINGFASLMLEKEIPREQQLVYLKIIQEESDRLSKLTSNTILLSKLSSQEVISKTEAFDLGEQLRQCSIILSNEWLAKELDFSGEFPSVTYVGNRELMQHLWINLLGNAIKYTPCGGEISITLTHADDQSIVKISDSGVGMDEETRQHLFEPYYQGETSHSTQGLGLGLAICKQIVSLCEGTITVESTLNEGSTFTIYLPDHPESEN